MSNKTITAVHYDGDAISQFKLSDGTVIGLSEAVQMCQNEELPGYTVGVTRAGTNCIRGVNDGDPDNNLRNLPRF